METKEKIIITVQTIVNAPLEKVWELWTEPNHIVHWNNASDDWHTPKAENDLRVGGKFRSRMEARDGSIGFDFSGKYDTVDPQKLIEYTLDDDRKVQISFISQGNVTTVTENFEAEETNSVELQQKGWQAILDNFKKYTEASAKFELMHFEININANAEKVYKTMLDEKTYAEWTAAFNPVSYFKGSWQKGSKIAFLGTDKDGTLGGMVSKIRENIPNKFVSIEHLGLIQGDKEIISGPEIEDWAGATENYSFTGNNGNTLLSVDLDANDEFKTYFVDTWPKALGILKEICEK